MDRQHHDEWQRPQGQTVTDVEDPHFDKHGPRARMLRHAASMSSMWEPGFSGSCETNTLPEAVLFQLEHSSNRTSLRRAVASS